MLYSDDVAQDNSERMHYFRSAFGFVIWVLVRRLHKHRGQYPVNSVYMCCYDCITLATLLSLANVIATLRCVFI
jgi:hypothetical protein